MATVKRSLNCNVSLYPPAQITHPTGHLHELQPPVGLGHKVGRTRVRDRADTKQTVVQRWVLTDSLTEGTTLEVENKSRHLLRETEKVDGSVEQRGLKFGIQINVSTANVNYTLYF
jgi:hypothetical protein